MALTLRTLKGSRLTHKELDDNFRHFTGSHTVDGTVTATAFVGDGSGLTNLPGASLTGTGILSGSIQIAELGAGIVSGSSQLDGEVFGFGADIVATGSFTGSFVGDGSGLTGISAGASAISGLTDVNLNALSDGEYLSYDAASTRWVNVAAPAVDLTGTEVISGSGFVHNNPGGGVFPTWTLNEYISLNQGLSVLASGNNPFVTIDSTSSTSTDPVLKVLGSNSTEELVVTNTEVQINDKLTLNSQFSNGGIIPTTDGLVTARVFHDTVRYVGHVSASLFSGSFVGDGSNLTGITPDLTGTTVISGSGLEYNSAQTRWDFSKAIVNDEGSFFGQKLMIHANNYLLNNEGARWLNTNIGHQDVAMKFYTQGSNNNDIEINVVQGHISASAFSGSFSGSFEGDGSGLTGIAADLTGTGIVSGSNWSYTPNNLQVGWKFDGAFQMSDNIMNFGTNPPTSFGNLYFGTPGGATGITSQTDIGFVKSKLQFYSDHNNVVWDQDQVIELDGTTGQVSASSFTGSFVGDGSQLTGLPAGNVPFIAGTTLPAKASSVTGSMILIENQGGLGNNGAELYIYNGAAGTGWRQIQFV